MTTPEHLHLALNHLPFLGAGFAIIPLLFGLAKRNLNALVAGAAIAALSGWMTPIVMETGEEAYERYEEGPVAAVLDPGAEAALEEHEHRAEAWVAAFYLNAFLATLGMILPIWKPKSARLVATVLTLSCLTTLFAGVWVAESGGTIRRPDFRSPADPATRADASHQREVGDHDD